MLPWSFSVGRLFGTEVRIHALLGLLLPFAVFWSAALGRTPARGLLLWLALLLALVVREAARALTGAWYGVAIRELVLLPTGAVATLWPGTEERMGPDAERSLALAGPVANALFAAALAGLILAVAPSVDLLGVRWVSPLHLLRSAVWLNLLMSAVNLLPAWPLDGARRAPGAAAGAAAGRAGGSAVPAGLRTTGPLATRRLLVLLAAIGLIVAGILTANGWLTGGGLGLLFFTQADRQGLLARGGMDSVRVREIMMTDYRVLSASATLEDALEEARHTLQDWFPVVRGGSVVGSIGRQAVLDAVESTGNSYVQGVMVRSFEVAAPDEPLSPVLSRVTASGSSVSQLVPVLEGDRIVGILTPEHLQRATTMLSRERARRQARAMVDGDDR